MQGYIDEEVKILVVDDDPEVLFATSRVLKSAGYQVLQAASGQECLEVVRRNPPTLILLDVVLPDIDGIEVCRRIKQEFKDLRIFIVLVSGMKTASEEQADGLEGGADGYIARPISNKELLARVRAMLRIAQAEQERDRLYLELKEAQARVKVLSGLLPICCHCKNIRDDAGYWSQLESYVQKHSEASFSHGICPECAQKYYPELGLYEDED